MTYWDEWETEAIAFLKGQTEEPPQSPNTKRILLLVQACRMAEKVLIDTRGIDTKPAYEFVKKVLLEA
jgi:hypothetical protein